MQITASTLAFISKLVRDEAGLQISEDQGYLLQNRLSALIEREGLDSIDTLVHRLKNGPDMADLKRKVVESMVTTETYFFRDNNPYEVLKSKLIPALMQGRPSQTLTIWSAACSTGQEPYSLAILLKEAYRSRPEWKFRILASDISEENIRNCQIARYNSLAVSRGLTPEMRDRYFKPVGNEWLVEQEIRDMVEFKPNNLLDSPWPLTQADVVFCRNVLIYFDVPTKQAILRRIRQMLPPDGALFLGSGETTVGIAPEFEPVYGDGTVYFRGK